MVRDACSLNKSFCCQSKCGFSLTAASFVLLGSSVQDPTIPSKLLDGTSDYVLTYEDKEGDWMLVGDVPWGYVSSTCFCVNIRHPIRIQMTRVSVYSFFFFL